MLRQVRGARLWKVTLWAEGPDGRTEVTISPAERMRLIDLLEETSTQFNDMLKEYDTLTDAGYTITSLR